MEEPTPAPGGKEKKPKVQKEHVTALDCLLRAPLREPGDREGGPAAYSQILFLQISMLELANRHYSSTEILLVDVKVTYCAAYHRNCTAYYDYIVLHPCTGSAESPIKSLPSHQ